MHGAAEGDGVLLEMPEMGVVGRAEVLWIGLHLEIEPLPDGLDQRECRLVTGTFRHTSGEVYDLRLSAKRGPVGATAMFDRSIFLGGRE